MLFLTNQMAKPAEIWRKFLRTKSFTKQFYHRNFCHFLHKMFIEKTNFVTFQEVPKRPSPPFVQFVNDRNQTLQNQYPDIRERVKHASQLWKNLAMVEKQRYTATYKNKMNEYTNNLSQEDLDLIQEKKDAKTAKQQKSDVRRYGKVALKERPVAPVKSAYNMFVKDKAGAITDTKNFMKIAGEQWRNLPIHQKAVYHRKIEDSSKAYEKELADWKEKYDKQA